MDTMCWLKCRASKGQFSDELAVSGSDYQGEDFSFFVNKQFVDIDGDVELGEEVDARLQVIPLAEKAGLVLIQLPGQTFGNGRTITVKDGDLEKMDCRSTL